MILAEHPMPEPNWRLSNLCEQGEHERCDGEPVIGRRRGAWRCACLCHNCRGDQRRALIEAVTAPTIPACPTVHAALYGDDPCGWPR